MAVNTDPDYFENLLRQVIREEVWGAAVQAVPFSEFTFSNSLTALNTTIDAVDGNITAVTTDMSGDTVTVAEPSWSGGMRIISAPNTQPQHQEWVGSVPAIYPAPVPYPEIVDTRTLGQFMQAITEEQSVSLPEDMEMLKECQISDDRGKDVELELRIRGPVIPRSILKKIPPEMFKILDLEIKRAMIRAFNLQPTEQRKRMVIVEEEE